MEEELEGFGGGAVDDAGSVAGEVEQAGDEGVAAEGGNPHGAYGLLGGAAGGAGDARGGYGAVGADGGSGSARHPAHHRLAHSAISLEVGSADAELPLLDAIGVADDGAEVVAA